MLTFCGVVCCWGFVVDNTLLIFASKVGYPIAIAAGSISQNFKKILSILYYTILLILVSILYFHFTGNTISSTSIAKYVPSYTDFILAIGLGAALTHFWTHPLNLNVVVMAAALAFLLPAAIMAGYLFTHHAVFAGIHSLILYFEYVVGIYLGSSIIRSFK